MDTIACLGRGSLVWDPRELPTRRGWFNDGPLGSVEFLCQSKDGLVALVFDEGSPPVRLMWALLDVASLKDGQRALAGAKEFLIRAGRLMSARSIVKRNRNPSRTPNKEF